MQGYILWTMKQKKEGSPNKGSRRRISDEVAPTVGLRI